MDIIPENPEHQNRKIVLRFDGTSFHISDEPLRQREDPGSIFFEKNWPHYLTAGIYHDGYQHS